MAEATRICGFCRNQPVIGSDGRPCTCPRCGQRRSVRRPRPVRRSTERRHLLTCKCAICVPPASTRKKRRADHG